MTCLSGQLTHPHPHRRSPEDVRSSFRGWPYRCTANMETFLSIICPYNVGGFAPVNYFVAILQSRGQFCSLEEQRHDELVNNPTFPRYVQFTTLLWWDAVGMIGYYAQYQAKLGNWQKSNLESLPSWQTKNELKCRFLSDFTLWNGRLFFKLFPVEDKALLLGRGPTRYIRANNDW